MAAKKHGSKATIRIVIPKRKHRRTVLVRGHYVSSATESIAIAITPAGGGGAQHFNADLTPASNPNCTSSLVSPLVCTISISLAPGSYTGTFATYDGLLGGNGNPTGNELSANQNVPFTFVAGKNNVLSVALDGIPASVALLPLGGTLSGNATSGYTISKCFSSARVEVLGLDADDNPILGPGAPTPALSSNDTTHIAVATPGPLSPNTFVLSRPTIPNPYGAVQLTAAVTPATGSGGSTQSAHVTVTFNTDVCGVITEFPIPTSSSGPTSIAAGPDGALWFTERLGDKIGRITTAGTITEFSVPTSGSWPSSITTGPGGELWFTEYLGQKLAQSTTGGTITENSTVANPYDITTGPDGALWFTQGDEHEIGQFTTGGTVAEFTVPTSFSLPEYITTGPDGALWFTETEANKIGRITTGGTIVEFSVPTSNSGPEVITTGPDGALWFAEFCSGKIGRITTGGTITEFSISNSDMEPYGIITGPDGALWFTEEGNGGEVGRMTTAGTVTQYEIPALNSVPANITSGPDGTLWFSESVTNKIGRIQ